MHRGQEIYSFFFKYGINGLFGIIISSIIIGIIIHKTFKISKKYKINNYKDFLECFIKNRKIKVTTNIIINIFILVSFYIMIAGFGAYIEQEVNINSFIGSSVLAFLCLILFRKNIDGIVKINEILIPILIFVVFIIRNKKFRKY